MTRRYFGKPFPITLIGDKNHAKMQAEAVRRLTRKYKNDERYSGGPGTLIDETRDDPAEYDPYDERRDE